MSAKFQRPHQFYKDDTCRMCKLPRHRHRRVAFHGRKGTEYYRYQCPDLSLPPDPDWDDDPWAEQDVTPMSAIADLFDKYK